VTDVAARTGSDNVGAEHRRPVRRALVSVSDKRGLAELAAGLAAAGVEIVSTGSTASVVADSGVPVTRVEDVTGFPECLDGRVKTLHPAVHAGLLADVRDPRHVRQLADLGVAPFDLVVVNLYPFVAAVRGGASRDEAVEQIDVGGPAMVRAAAKNAANVAVVVSPERYPEVLAAVEAGGFTVAQRLRLAVEAFAATASYDIAVASWLGRLVSSDSDDGAAEDAFPAWLGASFERVAALRYGENPHQRAALYADVDGAAADGGLARAEQLHGKQMSYNNYVDTETALRAANDFRAPCVAIVKHANPCGIAVGSDIADAYQKALDCDPGSAFGGVVATNRPVSLEMAEQVADVFTEVIVAPSYEPGAVELLTRKPSIRILRTSARGGGVDVRKVCGGLLVQSADMVVEPGDDPANWTLRCGDPADPRTLADLEFAWRACRSVKSNAVLLANGGASVGVGMGQVNRVDAARLAVTRAGSRAAGAVAASDAFFPFPDGLEVLLDAGVRAVVQPGGSVRDDEVAAAAERAGATMYLTGVRHFAH
jgi:phosphoribosylaminoimidazolecarboxamide formyltransferase / IMP cyclohydrolase